MADLGGPGFGGRPPLVVLLDDEPRILASLGRLLRNEPLEVLATESPDQAFDWIRTRTVALVIADYRMPAVDGIRFLESVRETDPSVARMLLTGYPGESVILRLKAESGVEVVPKPWDNARLRTLIRSLIGIRSPRRAVPKT